MRRLIEWVDARDVLLGVGLSMMAYGLHDMYPPLAWAVPGAVLVGLAVVAQLAQKGRGE